MPTINEFRQFLKAEEPAGVACGRISGATTCIWDGDGYVHGSVDGKTRPEVRNVLLGMLDGCERTPGTFWREDYLERAQEIIDSYEVLNDAFRKGVIDPMIEYANLQPPRPT